MKRFVFTIVCILYFVPLYTISQRMKVLHLTFHEGCKNDFQEVAQELNLDVTTWYVQALPPEFWEGFVSGNEIYNVGPRRAQRVWDRHHDFFNQFDVVVTSDTAPLSRIFLQNNWKKPLIIWVCNRFDYAHGTGGEDHFPDKEYYELMRKATKMSNVRIVSYTPYEYEYARKKGVYFGERVIKPLGRKEQLVPEIQATEYADKAETVFVFPRLAQSHMNYVLRKCKTIELKACSGVYNGPDELKGFKGVLFFPYAFSNLALFENLQRGVIHFVPTKLFLTQLGFVRGGMHSNLHWSEWYFDIYKDYLVFFDSWHDLREKIKKVDYPLMKEKIRAFGNYHRTSMLQEWEKLFSELVF